MGQRTSCLVGTTAAGEPESQQHRPTTAQQLSSTRPQPRDTYSDEAIATKRPQQSQQQPLPLQPQHPQQPQQPSVAPSLNLHHVPSLASCASSASLAPTSSSSASTNSLSSAAFSTSASTCTLTPATSLLKLPSIVSQLSPDKDSSLIPTTPAPAANTVSSTSRGFNDFQPSADSQPHASSHSSGPTAVTAAQQPATAAAAGSSQSTTAGAIDETKAAVVTSLARTGFAAARSPTSVAGTPAADVAAAAAAVKPPKQPTISPGSQLLAAASSKAKTAAAGASIAQPPTTSATSGASKPTAAATAGAAAAAKPTAAKVAAAPPKPTGAAKAVAVDLIVPLQPAVLGLSQLEVSCVQLSDVTEAHVEWLRAGWDLHPPSCSSSSPSAAAGFSSGSAAAPSNRPQAPMQPQQTQQQQGVKARKNAAKGPPPSSGPSPARLRVVGYDTEFLGDQLALLQLCCGGRALLVRVPSLRPHLLTKQQRGGGKAGGGSGSSSSSSSWVGGSTSGEQPQFPFSCPLSIRKLLCDPTVPKAAAEAWQDALMVFAAFGIKLRNGLDLTVAVPPTAEEEKRGRKKLSLFAIFEKFFPESTLEKDRGVDHSQWFTSRLDSKQLKYAALDAFVSYAAGVAVLRDPSCASRASSSRVDLTVPSPWEVTLSAQWLAVSQFLESGNPERTKSDFYSASFEEHKKQKELVLVVRMSRFKTRLRRNCWAELQLPDGRRINGRCVHANGKTAHIGKLKWSRAPGATGAAPGAAGSGSRDVRPCEVASLGPIRGIEMVEMGETLEEEAAKDLVARLMRGAASLKTCQLASAIFGGGGDSSGGGGGGGSGVGTALGSSSAAAAAAVSAALAAKKAGPGGGRRGRRGSSTPSSTPSTTTASASTSTRTSTAVPAAVRAVVLLHLRGLRDVAAVNPSQHEAIQELLLGDSAVQLVQGPPGTGKTTVISHAVNMWTRLMAARTGSSSNTSSSGKGDKGNSGSKDGKNSKGKGAPANTGGGGGGAQNNHSTTSEALVCVARSNVAARNIALALLKREMVPKEFRLVVSHEFHYEWHEEQYRGALESVLVTSDELSGTGLQRRLEEVRVYVTTVSMLANSKFRDTALHGKKLTHLVVDEASQIYMGDLLLPLSMYGSSLRRLSLFGDDQQLPPFGSEWEGAHIPSMFDHLSPRPVAISSGASSSSAAAAPRLRPGVFLVGPQLAPPPSASAPVTVLQHNGGGGGSSGGCSGVVRRLMLSVSYRLPPALCKFISKEMYGNALQSGAVSCKRWPAVRWIDVAGGREDHEGGPSCCNPPELAAAIGLVKRELQESSWTILTGYDLQRCKLEREVNQAQLRRRSEEKQGGQQAAAAAASHGASSSVASSSNAAAGGKGANGGGGGSKGASGSGSSSDGFVDGTDRVYNIDTFQGREDEVVVVSLVRCRDSLGFMQDDRRVNVMLTRCSRMLVVVGSLQLARRHPASLIGRLALYCEAEGRVEQLQQVQQLQVQVQQRR